MVPVYQDISHFRAPYKNMFLSMGEEAPPPPAEMTGLDQLAAAMFVQKDGINYFKPEVKAQTLAVLENMKYIHMGGAIEWVKVEPYNPIELASGQKIQSAARWVEQKAASGKVVLAPVWILAPITTPERYLMAPSANDQNAIRSGAGTPYMGVLAGSPGLLGSLSNTTKLIIAGVAVAGAAAYFMKRRRG